VVIVDGKTMPGIVGRLLHPLIIAEMKATVLGDPDHNACADLKAQPATSTSRKNSSRILHLSGRKRDAEYIQLNVFGNPFSALTNEVCAEEFFLDVDVAG